jgi:hypothetical protein
MLMMVVHTSAEETFDLVLYTPKSQIYALHA